MVAERKDIKMILRGSQAILEFLGPSEEPVSEELAAARAAVCMKCPLNNPAKDWVEHVSKAVAKATQEYFRIKDGLDLRLPDEKKLGICAACYCPIKLKVWMPIDHILEHTTDETMADFAIDCWIPNEIK